MDISAKRWGVLSLSVVLLLALTFGSLSLGSASFSWTDFGHLESSDTLFWVSRLPRTIALMLAGSSMAVAGLVLQVVLRNRFIEPDMIGSTQSAGLGILLMTLFVPGAPLIVKAGVGACFALAGMSLFVRMTRHLRLEGAYMVSLVGMIFGGIIDAGSQYIAIETETLQLLHVWFTGDFSAILAGRYEWLWLSGLLTLGIYGLADRLTITGFGESLSKSLGVHYGLMLALALILTALITALDVVTVGRIPFLGLIVPNVVTRLMGDRLRVSLPIVAISGANLLMACDILGRELDYPSEIPVSTLFGLLGAAIFLGLLWRRGARS